MTESVFRHELRVVYAQCTVGNHVYYARYLDMLEEARGEFLRSVGAPCRELQEAGVVFPVLGVEIAYLGPARYDDLLTIELWLTELSGVRASVGFRILCGERELATGVTRHVCAGTDEKPRRIPKELAEKLRPFLRSGSGTIPR